ncbi:MAG: NADH-quinone oxidoreductase subunit D [Candidatus Micrarchaeota archaeon]|nr:NADH-quinone oxidoreductase subunit D [Candidatus Micrarchaeota archaeon]
MPTMQINVGPIHPSTHGVLKLVVDVDGDTVKRVEPHIGFLHRGVEKLVETRMYMQSPSYMEKLDYVAPLSWDELFVSAVEKATKIEVKERAQYARMVLLEFQRIASHLLWLGTFCNDMGQMFTAFMWAFRDRARVIKFLEDVSGSRMFYVNLRLGGLDRELPPGFKEEGLELADYIYDKIHDYRRLLEDDPIFIERTRNVGILKLEDAIELGVSGPVLRASGMKEDVRASEPYYFYNKIHFKVPTQTRADSLARYRVRMEEIVESVRIIKHALNMMPEKGDVKGLPIKLLGPNANPDPITISRELPRGEGMIYMVPDKQKPYRLSMRSPAFANLQALSKLCEGVKFADIFTILGSLDIVLAEIDR